MGKIETHHTYEADINKNENAKERLVQRGVHVEKRTMSLPLIRFRILRANDISRKPIRERFLF